MVVAMLSSKSKKSTVNVDNFDLREVFGKRDGLLVVLLFTITIQLAISCGSYSGYGKPPMYGDFEAQRHWMEITVNLPIEQWYLNGSDNDLNYWGLDYPPLTAYHSYLLGKISQNFNKSWVSLWKSRGIEEENHKFFMRMTVLSSMWLLYMPALLYFVFYQSSYGFQNYYAAVAVLYPGLIAIDNGHFQYNHVALGLFLLSILFFTSNRLVFGSVAFVLAVHFKQMELYHALPIAVYLFFVCFSQAGRESGFTYGLRRLLKLVFFVALSVFLLWMPLRNTSGFPFTILHRLFPFSRGIFEDKVASFWCILNVAIKLKQRFALDELVKMSTVVVVTTHIPSLLILARRPTIGNLKKALFLSGLSFFLFSFQVHEKSILFVTIPALLLWPQHCSSISWFLVISNISLYPLCIQDGNALHLALFIFYYCLVFPTTSKLSLWKFIVLHVSCFTGFAICFASLVVPSPKRFPHIFPLMVAAYSFIHFMGFFLFFNILFLKENVNSLKVKKS